jgi:hypothetical protein
MDYKNKEERGKICRGGFMLLIANVTITIVQTRPHPLSTFKSCFLWFGVKNLQVTGGVGQVRSEVNCKFELIA